MIVILCPAAAAEDVAAVAATLSGSGFRTYSVREGPRILLITERAVPDACVQRIQGMRNVDDVVQIAGAQRLTCRDYRASDTLVEVGGQIVGGTGFVVIAGPCAVENRQQMTAVADAVSRSGAAMLRGGAFKPRSSPYSFQGLGFPGLELLTEQRRRTGLPIVTEVMEPAHVEDVAQQTDVLQIGARNMQNFGLLREVGRTRTPVLLKRGLSATIDEWLLAAEYVLSEGNDQVILCERGVRGFEPATRFTLDLSAVAFVKRIAHLPVVVDPSHATGRSYLVRPMSLAAAAAGADGLLIDVHTSPAQALCDGGQALSSEEFTELMDGVARIVEATGRSVAKPPSVVASGARS